MRTFKILCLILCFCMLILLPGCGLFNPIASRLAMLDLEVPKAEAENLETTKTVLNCFSEKDAEALKILLCPKTQELIDIDEQIQKCFDVFNGKVTSFDEHLLGSEEEHVEYGKKTFLERGWGVDNIKTDTNETYEMYIRKCYINEEDKDREGISEIILTSSDGTELVIGYPWPSYYYDGSVLSREVIEAISEKNMNSLKYLLCDRTLEMTDIDLQIKEGFSFFEGKATMGERIVNGQVYSDGDDDYQTSVKDDEVVINGKPTQTFITVHNYNIETDKGKNYQLDFEAYLLYEDNKSYEGISQIIIMDDKGKKQVVIGEKLE